MEQVLNFSLPVGGFLMFLEFSWFKGLKKLSRIIRMLLKLTIESRTIASFTYEASKSQLKVVYGFL